MLVQFSDTPYARVSRPSPDEALRRARAALKDMAQGSVRRSSMGLRLGKLGIRYSSTSLSFGGQAAQAEPEAASAARSASQATPQAAPRTRAVGHRPQEPADTAQVKSPAQTVQSAQAAQAGATLQTAAFTPSLFARARQRMADALLGQAADADRDARDSLDSLLRGRRGQAAYAESLRPSSAPGCILSCAV